MGETENNEIRPFRVNIPEEAHDDLRRREAETARLPGGCIPTARPGTCPIK